MAIAISATFSIVIFRVLYSVQQNICRKINLTLDGQSTSKSLSLPLTRKSSMTNEKLYYSCKNVIEPDLLLLIIFSLI